MPELSTSHWIARPDLPLAEMTVGDLLRTAAAKVPEQTALVAGAPDPEDRRRWTFKELLDEAEQAARALLARFEPGERVAIWAPNVPEWVILEAAAGLAGLILVSVNPAYRASELRHVLQMSGAAGIFLVQEHRGNPMAKLLEEVRGELPNLRSVIALEDWQQFVRAADDTFALPSISPSAAAQIQFTSGTTGAPKGALLSHRAIVNNARFCVERMELAEGDVWLNPTPMFHTGGCVIVALGTIAKGVTHIPMLQFDPGLALELIETERVTVMGAVPTILITMMEHPDVERRDLSSLRSVLSGGSSVPAELVRHLERSLGLRFGIAFGQTEASPSISQTRLDDTPEDKSGTIGQPLPHVEVKIADPASGDTVAPGVVGEICCRGYNVMLGYDGDPDATADAIDEEGWLRTGDLGAMDERGYLRIEGRLKDMVIRGGVNLYPAEIEGALFAHPAVAEAAVFGVPDPKWGEVLAAAVRRAPGYESVAEEELRAHVRDRLAPYKAPQHWFFPDQMPMTPSGKIQKFVLRDRYLEEIGDRARLA